MSLWRRRKEVRRSEKRKGGGGAFHQQREKSFSVPVPTSSFSTRLSLGLLFSFEKAFRQILLSSFPLYRRAAAAGESSFCCHYISLDAFKPSSFRKSFVLFNFSAGFCSSALLSLSTVGLRGILQRSHISKFEWDNFVNCDNINQLNSSKYLLQL